MKSRLLDFTGRVVPVSVSSSVYHEGSAVSPDECAEKMIYVTQCKVQEVGAVLILFLLNYYHHKGMQYLLEVEEICTSVLHLLRI